MKKPGCKIRKYNTYRIMPWRNGRGSTLEIAREPATGEDFAWKTRCAIPEGRYTDLSPSPQRRRQATNIHRPRAANGAPEIDRARDHRQRSSRCAVRYRRFVGGRRIDARPITSMTPS
jgi:hypothetical protein